jgi:hypothetical protein
MWGLRGCVLAFAWLLLFAGGVSVAATALHDPFVPSTTELRVRCKATARSVGYPVPCPTRVPSGLAPYGGRPGCELEIIGPARHCPNTQFLWRGWAVGSSTTADEHLVLSASPRPVASFAKMVNGPAWYPDEHVRVLGSVRAGGWMMSEVFVTPATNDGSAFAGHVVLIWTVGQHTYAVGFHDVSTVKQTLALDVTFARSIKLVGPNR